MKFVSGRGIAAGVLVVVIAAACIRLGFWQLDRLEQRRAHNEALAAAMAKPILALEGETLRAVAAEPERYRYRRARVTGEYHDPGTLLLRGRSRGGTPGVHLVTPLRVADRDSAILVDRGWLPAPDAATADPSPFRRAGPVVVEGLIHPAPPIPESALRAVSIQAGDVEIPTYQRLALSAIQAQSGLKLLPFYLERTASPAGEAALPLGAPPPRLDEGPHLGYALQWFGFAAVAVIGFVVVAMRLAPRS